MGLRDEILGRDDLPVEVVTVPEWGMDVRVRALSGKDRDGFEASCLKAQGQPGPDGKPQLQLVNVRARLVVLSVVDETGARVFTDEDATALGAKNGKVLDQLFEVAQRLSGLRPADVKELVGNSEGAPAAS
jgi:hypothetical protein